MTALIMVLALIGAAVVFVWGLYNSLVTGKTRVEESWSQIDVQLKMRADLIPSLSETVRAHMSQEQKIFGELAEARKAVQTAEGVPAAEAANRQLTGVLGRLLAIVEDNPEITSDKSFQDFRDKDTAIEEKIRYSRQFYNTSVTEYNIRLKSFPNVLLASPLGFAPAEFFEAAEGEREKPPLGRGSYSSGRKLLVGWVLSVIY